MGKHKHGSININLSLVCILLIFLSFFYLQHLQTTVLPLCTWLMYIFSGNSAEQDEIVITHQVNKFTWIEGFNQYIHS